MVNSRRRLLRSRRQHRRQAHAQRNSLPVGVSVTEISSDPSSSVVKYLTSNRLSAGTFLVHNSTSSISLNLVDLMILSTALRPIVCDVMKVPHPGIDNKNLLTIRWPASTPICTSFFVSESEKHFKSSLSKTG